MPLVRRILSQELGVTVATDTHPKYAVCLGAAIAAGSLLKAEPLPTITREPELPAVPAVHGTPAMAATSIMVDLERAGLTDAALVPVRPAAELRRRPRIPENETLAGCINADETYTSAAHRTLVITAVLVVLMVAMVVLMATLT